MIIVRGWWRLEITDLDQDHHIDRNDESTLEYIGKMITDGFNQGELIQEREIFDKYSPAKVKKK